MYELGLEQTNLENEMEAEARHGIVCVEKGGPESMGKAAGGFGRIIQEFGCHSQVVDFIA